MGADPTVNDHMQISWYGNAIENFLLQIYASDSDQLPTAFGILNNTLGELHALGMREGHPCKSPGWIRCNDGLCYPHICPPFSGGGP